MSWERLEQFCSRQFHPRTYAAGSCETTSWSCSTQLAQGTFLVPEGRLLLSLSCGVPGTNAGCLGMVFLEQYDRIRKVKSLRSQVPVCMYSFHLLLLYLFPLYRIVVTFTERKLSPNLGGK